VAYAEQASFYRAALLLGLIRGDRAIAWADEVLAGDSSAPAAFAELATTEPDDLTAMRERLFEIGGGKESATVVLRLLGLVQTDLASGRRSFADTMTILKQLRAFVAVGPDLNEQVKSLGVGVAIAKPDSPERAAAEQCVRDWLLQYA